MATPPILCVPGATFAVTRRTVLRKAFLAPWDPLVRQVILFALADAQTKYQVEVHHSADCVNHYHGLFTPAYSNLSAFLGRFHRDVSVGLQELLLRHRYDQPGELWDDRQTHTMRLMDSAAQAAQLVYHRLNPVAAGLVDRPEHWPGVNTHFGLWKHRRHTVRRPDLDYFRHREASLELVLTPPPLLYRDFGGDLNRLVHHLDRLTDQGARALRQQRDRPVLGARAARRLHPWDEPRTPRERRSHRRPTFKYGAAGWAGVQQRIEGAREVSHFRDSHRKTRLARRDGDSSATYPYGTYAAKVYRDEPVESEPLPDAAVLRPGPTFADVVAEIAAAKPQERGEPCEPLLDAVRGAVTDEAKRALEELRLDFDRRPRSPSAPTRKAAPPRPASGTDSAGDAGNPEDEKTSPHQVAVRHRVDSRADLESASRVVRLRDQRRGRPRRRKRADHKSSGGGSDPPA